MFHPVTRAAGPRVSETYLLVEVIDIIVSSSVPVMGSPPFIRPSLYIHPAGAIIKNNIFQPGDVL